MKFKPRILEYLDKVDSSCSFWRGVGTNSELERQGLIETQVANWNENWSTIRKFHIAFFQRPVHKMCLDQVLLCKDLGLKIWVDLDDWKDLPKEHAMYKEYYNNYEELIFKKILYAADIITVTNVRMMNMYSNIFFEVKEKVKIIYNAINDYVYNFKPLSNNKRIVYRGGINHEYDIKEYQEAIREVLIDNPDWNFISIGQDIKRLRSLSNYQYLDKFELHFYFGLICNLNPSIFIVPLKDNKLNRAKSNISWLEGSLSGAACLCPNFWDDTISQSYNSDESFKIGLETLIKSESLRKKLWLDSVSKIKHIYLLSIQNKNRMNIINSLL